MEPQASLEAEVEAQANQTFTISYASINGAYIQKIDQAITAVVIHKCKCRARDWSDVVAEIAKRDNVVELTVTNSSIFGKPLAHLSTMAGLQRLILGSSSDSVDRNNLSIKCLERIPALASLRHLSICGNHLNKSKDGCRALLTLMRNFPCL